ncbi:MULTISPECIES: LysR family transcriptional regulator [unclassified Paenibacillus]|nr:MULTISPECIES: LysR family transcriptional regulator [unclassified Paenibacillus]MDF9841555.1 LysR family transcriptional activator of glutamate synthase operon [Paenibacillus sp. PastF-2]MDF9848333.1 LysR family transcriptional activator of glutamate synthase operon [Paenibacillus sp. PastM-2]MDF9854714.1 LysR family transcriptional activator of glutamate synthase operon [Paenibacillus sp. PastF-1]MDH6507418.1 LysR family transcriptional activator of glutamate synthase operon [Paenibacillus 
MRLEQLYHIVAIAQTGSISTAAERAYISQPALSSSVSKLEVELGVPLFKRTNQGVHPTEIGQAVIAKAMEAIDLLEDIKALAEENTRSMTGSIHLAVEPFISNTIMVNALTTFKYRHPNVNVLMKVGESNNNLRDIAAGKADFGVVMKSCSPGGERDLCFRELFRDRLVLLVSRESVLAAGGSIMLQEAMAQPLVLYNTEFATDCWVSELLGGYGECNVAYRLDSFPMLEKVISQNLCAAFAPKFMSDYFVNKGSIIPLEITGAELDVSIVLAWTKRHHLSLIEKEMMETIKSFCAMFEFIG